MYWAWSCILLSISPVFVLRKTVATKPLILGGFFSTSAISLLWTVTLSKPQV